VKSSKIEIHAKVHKIPRIRFSEERKLTSYSGLVIFQALFHSLKLRARLRRCFQHLAGSRIFGHVSIMLLLVVHIVLGFRRLRGLDFYRGDPLVARVVGLRTLPDVATVSRTLASFDDESVENLSDLIPELVLERLKQERFKMLTIDFDGSVQSTKGHAEGTAVGFNKVKKGARSYYDLFATVAQTSQFFDRLHRPGNVHDSNGAAEFIARTLHRIKAELPGVKLECRIDSAFYNKVIFWVLTQLAVEFTCSVPFERFPKLKAIIGQRQRWRKIDDDLSYFECDWKPKEWQDRYRLMIIRKRTRTQTKGPLQLDLFRPLEYGYEYKVVTTNKTDAAADVLLFHNGRGSQEKLFGEAKQHAALDLIPTRRKVGNQVFTLAGMLAHNLGRELQMSTSKCDRGDREKRPARWEFESLGTIRQHLLHNAGTLTRPQGELTLTMNANDAVRDELTRYLDGLMKNAA
jgi:hypothetical protein